MCCHKEVLNECDEGALRPLEGRVDSPLREVLHVKLKTDSVHFDHYRVGRDLVRRRVLVYFLCDALSHNRIR